MLETGDLRKIDELQILIDSLIDRVVRDFSALTSAQQATVMKVIRGLDGSWEKLLADAGESKAEVPEKSIRALLACGYVMASMAVIQADDQITEEEHEILLHLTDRFSDPLSLGGMVPVSSETTSGTIEFYSHMVDTYDVMDYRVAGTLCAAIDALGTTKLMTSFARYVTQLGSQITFVDGDGADQRERRVLDELEESMKRLSEVIENANLQ